MKPQTKTKIENVKTLNEFLDVLNDDYNTEACKPSLFIKVLLINTLISKLSGKVLITESVKLKATQAQNIKEFISVVKENFTQEVKFTNPNLLIANLRHMVTLTNLKERDETPAPVKKVKAEAEAETPTPKKKRR